MNNAKFPKKLLSQCWQGFEVIKKDGEPGFSSNYCTKPGNKIEFHECLDGKLTPIPANID
jgi:hypothetical protein